MVVIISVLFFLDPRSEGPENYPLPFVCVRLTRVLLLKCWGKFSNFLHEVRNSSNWKNYQAGFFDKNREILGKRSQNEVFQVL